MKSCRIITACQNGGKSTYMEKLIRESNSPTGFISMKDPIGYSLRNIETGEERRYLSRNPEFHDRFKIWYIDYSVFNWASSVLSNIEEGSVFLDEVGKMELEKKGFYDSLLILKEKNIDLTLAVRDTFLDEVVSAFSLSQATVVSLPPLSSL